MLCKQEAAFIKSSRSWILLSSWFASLSLFVELWWTASADLTLAAALRMRRSWTEVVSWMFKASIKLRGPELRHISIKWLGGHFYWRLLVVRWLGLSRWPTSSHCRWLHKILFLDPSKSCLGEESMRWAWKESLGSIHAWKRECELVASGGVQSRLGSDQQIVGLTALLSSYILILN